MFHLFHPKKGAAPDNYIVQLNCNLQAVHRGIGHVNNV